LRRTRQELSLNPFSYPKHTHFAQPHHPYKMRLVAWATVLVTVLVCPINGFSISQLGLSFEVDLEWMAAMAAEGSGVAAAAQPAATLARVSRADTDDAGGSGSGAEDDADENANKTSTRGTTTASDPCAGLNA
jgi:hypothetical protein